MRTIIGTPLFLYSINKIAFMIIYSLNTRKNKSYVRESAFNKVKDQMEEELIKQRNYFEEYFNLSQKVIKDEIVLNKIKIMWELANDREFNEFTIKTGRVLQSYVGIIKIQIYFIYFLS